MENICIRCQKNKVSKNHIFMADMMFSSKFTKINSFDDLREYNLCNICNIKLLNYFNKRIQNIITMLYMLFGFSIFFFGSSLYIDLVYDAPMMFFLSIFILILGVILMPLSPIHNHKLKTSHFNLIKIQNEFSTYTFENYEKLSAKKQKNMRLKEFDYIFVADYVNNKLVETENKKRARY